MMLLLKIYVIRSQTMRRTHTVLRSLLLSKATALPVAFDRLPVFQGIPPNSERLLLARHQPKLEVAV